MKLILMVVVVMSLRGMSRSGVESVGMKFGEVIRVEHVNT